jgi:spermidine/putrescine transport system ATP-binding protein
VANFLGQANLFSGSISGRDGEDLVVTTHGISMRLPSSRNSASESDLLVGVRPEKITILDAVDVGKIPTGNNVVTGTVTDVSYTGVSTQYLVEAPWGQVLNVFEQNVIVGDRSEVGDPVVVHWAPEHTFGLGS